MAWAYDAASGSWKQGNTGTVGTAQMPKFSFDAGGQPIPTGDVFAKTGKGLGGNSAAIENIVGYGTANANYLNQEENARINRATGMVNAGTAAAQNPLLSQEQIDTQFGRGADAAAPNYLNQMQNLRDSLGGAGISGGQYGAAMASNYGLQRMGQVTDARRTTMLDAIKTNAGLRAQNFQTTLAQAAQNQTAPSMVNQDWIGQMLGMRQNMMGQDMAAKVAKGASTSALIGGGLGALGSFAGLLA